MGWKNWPYWLRGGVFFVVIYIIFWKIFTGHITLLKMTDPLYFLLFLVPDIGFHAFVLITGTISYFIIGIIIGFIYGLFKKH